MNVIVIMSDTLRTDHLGCYGAEGIRTPNIDRLGEESIVFNRAYTASYPTVPNRADLFTGRYTFPFRGWQPLEPSDIVLPEVVGRHGVTSQLIFDTPPLLYGNFMRGFSGWWYERGHHMDPYITDPTIPTPLPAAPHKFRSPARVRQYLRNRGYWRYEKDYIAPRTMTRAMEWLERNYTLDRFLLWVDAWDPHEPFDPPPHYLRLYSDPDEEVENVIYPQYGRCDYMTKPELKRVRALYAGEVTMVDTWTGQLLDTVDRLGLRESTLIVFTSDHGHLFGEHGLEGKPGGMLGRLYEITTRIPLIIRHPKGIGSGQRIDAIVQPPDILPTILEFLEIPIPKTVHGSSVWPLVRGEAEAIRNHAFSGRFPGSAFEALIYDGWAGPFTAVSPVTVTKTQWALICSPDPSKSELYNLDADPQQETNLIEQKPEIAAEMRRALIAFMNQVGAKWEIVDPFQKEMVGLRERLNPKKTLYLIRDDRGLGLAFPNMEQARKYAPPETRDEEVERLPLYSLVEREPRALVHYFDQYYWAEELSGP